MSLRRLGKILALLLGILAAPLAIHAQGPRNVPKIGYLVLSPLADPPSAERQAFLEGLRDLGYVVGQNLIIEYRSAAWNRELLPDLAATTTIPIVVPAANDPVESGLVASLARPGGNITGTAVSTPELTGKRLQLLKEALPKVSRVAVLWSPIFEAAQIQWIATQAAARALGLTLQSLSVRDPKDFPGAFSAMTRRRPDALLTIVSPLTTAYRPLIVEFATKHRLPTMFAVRVDVEAGGLMSYAPDVPDTFRRAAGYVDKVLRGAVPSSLPIQHPDKFELVINLKTARALSLEVPRILLARADKVIE